MTKMVKVQSFDWETEAESLLLLSDYSLTS